MSEEEIIKYLKNCLNDEFNFKHATRQKDKMAIQGLLDLYQKEKEKNKELEKTILQDTSHSMITRLEMKLKYDIEQINKKLTSDEYINEYRIARLKGIRTKCKELLELLEERN